MKKYLTKQQVLDYRRRVLKDSYGLGVSATARRYGLSRRTIYNWQTEIVPQKPGPTKINGMSWLFFIYTNVIKHWLQKTIQCYCCATCKRKWISN